MRVNASCCGWGAQSTEDSKLPPPWLSATRGKATQEELLGFWPMQLRGTLALTALFTHGLKERPQPILGDSPLWTHLCFSRPLCAFTVTAVADCLGPGGWLRVTD